jgi:hypothetical protein
VSTTHYLWNQSKNTWDPVFAYEYGYDEAGHLISRMIFDRYPNPLVWHPLEKMLYAFDSMGRKTQETRQRWNDTSRDWFSEVKTEWYYDFQADTTEYAVFRWTLAGTIYEWQENQRYRVIKEFDSSGNLVLTTELLKVSKTRWTPTMKEERAYNSSGQPVLTVISRGNGSLTEDFRSEWVYNQDGSLIQETLTGAQVRWPGGMPIKKKARTIRSLDDDGNTSLVIWYLWDALTKTYLFNSKDYYFYHSATTGHQEIVSDPIRVFPNPTVGMLNVSGLTESAGLKIFTIQGMLVLSVDRTDHSIDISALPPGTYLLIVSQKGRPPYRTRLIRQ